MPFTKFVEVGRIAYIAFGRDAGKICVIVDVIDQNRALIDGPLSRVRRQPCSFKRLHLTKFRINFQHSSSERVVKKAWIDEQITEKWAETSWAKRIEAKKLRNRLTDFDRFKLMKAKQSRNKTIKREYNKLKRKAKKLQEKPKPKVEKTKAPQKKAEPKPKGKKEPTKAEGKATGKAEGKATGKAEGKAAGKAEGKQAPKKETKKGEKAAKK